jgi:hypothetical protein
MNHLKDHARWIKKTSWKGIRCVILSKARQQEFLDPLCKRPQLEVWVQGQRALFVQAHRFWVVKNKGRKIIVISGNTTCKLLILLARNLLIFRDELPD